MLAKMHPVPSTSSISVNNVRKRGRQVATVLTSPEHIEKKSRLS